jgi:hypothetical protein
MLPKRTAFRQTGIKFDVELLFYGKGNINDTCT